MPVPTLEYVRAYIGIILCANPVPYPEDEIVSFVLKIYTSPRRHYTKFWPAVDQIDMLGPVVAWLTKQAGQ